MNRSDVAALHARIAQLERAQARRSHARRRAWLLAALCTGLLLALAPLGLLAGNNQQFADVDPNSVHAPNIVAIRQAGITTGCVPAQNLYCPSAYVRRDEMASFLARTAGLGSNPPVVNARTAVNATTATNAGHAASADNATSAGHASTADNATNAATATNAGHATSADTATSAGNATTVGGLAPNGLVRVAAATKTGETVLIFNTDYVSFVPVTFTAPGPGFVVVSATATVHSGSNLCGCEVDMQLHDVTANTFSGTMAGQAGTAAGATNLQTMALTYVFPVSSAGSRTYELLAKNLNPTTGVGIDDAQLTAIYLPFDGAGNMP